MDVLKKLFNPSVNQASPVQSDFDRTLRYDDEGNEFVTYEKTDYPSIQSSHGFLTDWSLKSLLKAGINPNFGIHTGLPTRIEGQQTVNDFDSVAESILSGASDLQAE